VTANTVFSSQAINAVPGVRERLPSAGVEPDRKREQKLTLIILLIAGAARLPFLWHGFGGHPDEWLVVRSGLDLWLHGSYYPSRLSSGFPFNEVLTGGLAWAGGEAACAIAATAACLIGLAYMRGLAPLHGIRNSFWMVLAFSFEPWVWSSSTHALDYIWGTASLIAAAYYVERRQLAPAGLACAIGFGFRPSSLLWIGPLFLRVVMLERGWRGVIRFALWAAIPALIPTFMIIWVLVSRPGAWGSFSEVGPAGAETIRNYLIPSALLAAYHFVEVMGQLPAVLLIVAACLAGRERLFALLRSGEGWVWTYLLMFVCLFGMFILESSKPEYMLPALPGLFMILGRSISDNWWKAITVAFIVNAFVSFGFGHAPRTQGVRLELGAPSLRPGVLLWYAERAKESNAYVARIGAELAEPSRIIRADPGTDTLDEFYASSLLTRGPASQARISCPLRAAFLALPQGGTPVITGSKDLSKPPPSEYPMAVCCRSMSALLLPRTPPWPDTELTAAVARFCASDAGISRLRAAAP
jgi:hypothetical protein